MCCDGEYDMNNVYVMIAEYYGLDWYRGDVDIE